MSTINIFSPNVTENPLTKSCRPEKRTTTRTNTDGIPFTLKNPSQPLETETNTTFTLMTTMATTTANRASASTPFATRGISVRSRAFSHFLPNFFFLCVCSSPRSSRFTLSLSLSLCSERGGRAVFWRFLARYSAFLSPSHACDLLAFLSLIERQGRISSNCKSSWRATLAK